MQCDILIKGGNVYFPAGEVGIRDLLIRDGKIIAVIRPESAEAKLTTADRTIVATDKTIVPGFVDSHMHNDKALIMEDDDTKTLGDAIVRSIELLKNQYVGMDYSAIVRSIAERTSEVIEKCIKNGTTTIKNHVLITDFYGFAGLDAMSQLKEKYADKVRILNIVPYEAEYDSQWRMAADKGLVDFIGGYPESHCSVVNGEVNFGSDYYQYIDNLFLLAKEYNLPLDFHCNESDVPDLTTFLYIIKLTEKYKMQGRVTCGHVTALSAKGISEEEAAAAIALCAKWGVNVVSLTTCNMYLMDDIRRGPTRVRQLRDYGVHIAIASDNVRDPFNPFGNCDLLEEALTTAQVNKFGTSADLTKLMRMITFAPAENCLLENYGTMPGCDANLVVLDAPNAAEAILSQVKKNYVIYNGKIVAENGQLCE